ncbi:MAG: CvpA family protein [Pirellulales bacterium]|nr:CvpA family protein [Pirellulales bacterium]
MYITIALLVIFFICLGMIFNEGLWGAAVMFINVLLSAMIATNFFEPLATWANSQMGSYTYLIDFVSLWLIFCVSLIVLRILTDTLSRYRVRFKKPVDIGGGLFFAAWIGWLMIQFSLFTLHTSPLSRNFFGGDFQPEPNSAMFFGLAPDRNWMAFMHKMGEDGSLGTGTPFDKEGDFILRYGTRRKTFEKQPNLRVNAP